MSVDENGEVRRLFAEAMELDPEERSAWLAEACSDPELRREVESLVEAAEVRGREVDEALAGLPDIADLVGIPGSQAGTAPEGRDDLVGREIGHYRIMEPLGHGGMGVVYRARDLRLERTVALKFLPPESMRDPESRTRFLHEAQAASALDHPAICTVHEIGESEEGHPFIVMAYVEGETLQEKIARRPLPVAEAVDIASQVALGLARAHEQGIVHRDVKAANVMVAGDGQVKILDFGLAKVRDIKLTRTGVTLGTVTCMSPEQVQGEGVDRRTDIWALGVLLYEMVTGRPPFRGGRTEAVVAAILADDPEPMTALRSDVPLELDGIVAKALAKDPADRYQHIDEIPVDLRAIATKAGGIARTSRTPRTLEAASPARRWRLLQAVGLGALAMLAGVGLWHLLVSSPGEPSGPVRFEVPFPTGWELASWYQPLAISPDGARVVFAVRNGDDVGLYMRDLDRLETAAIPGTDGGTLPFFSPDGSWIAFFAGGELRKVPVDGGIPQTICAVPQASRGATWGPDDTIVFTAGVNSGLLQVPSSGGTPKTLTVPDLDAGEVGHYWPQYLPGGRDLLFTIWSADGWRTAVLSSATGKWRVVLEGGAAARYVPTGHLLFAQMSVGKAQPSLRAVAFDGSEGEVLGSPVSVLGDPGVAGPNFAVSSSGTLVYVAGGSAAWAGLAETSLAWLDQEGRTTPVLEHSGYFEAPRVSPDGSRIAVPTFSPSGAADVWVYDLERGTNTRVTLTGSINNYPVWDPDGKTLVFNSSRFPAGIYRKSADGSGSAEQILRRDREPQIPGSWSPDGATLAYTGFDDQERGDIWVLSRQGDAVPLVATSASETSPMFSPDGEHLAYVSDASGRDEVYVREYPGPGAALLVSTDGGREPSWGADGRTLFYRNGDALMSVEVGSGPTIQASRPREIFRGALVPASFGQTNYDVAPDGRLLVVQPVPPSGPTRLIVVLNWFPQLESLVAGSQ